MKTLIIEDEPLAASHLQTFIQEYNNEFEIIEILDSVESAVFWLQNNEHPPLIFMDIHLGDGDCFEIFNQIKIDSSIIFTTAYDQYAIQAFKVNSIDYLLKPLNKEDLFAALDKFNSLNQSTKSTITSNEINRLLQAMQKPAYKERFIVKVGTHIRPVNISDIICFYSLEKATYLITNEGKHYLIDFALDKLQELLDPSLFFRISRKHIIAIHAIKDVINQSSTRAKVKLTVAIEDELIISRDKIKPFKLWLDGA